MTDDEPGTPHTDVHRLSRRFLEPAQDLLVIAGVLVTYLVFFPAARVITLIPILFIPWIVELPAVLYLGL